jgi:pilus assembly protein CpaF
MGAEAENIVEAEVRELVKRRRLDPSNGGAAAIRELTRDVVAEYQERTLSSKLPGLSDPEAAVKTVFDRVAGLGLLQPYLDDPAVEEIWINEPGRVFVVRCGEHTLTNTILAEHEVRDLVEVMLKSSGRRVDLSSPFVDATLEDGSRLHVAIPDITRRHWAVNIRKFLLQAHSLEELVRLGTLPAPAARFLEAAVVAGLNIIVSGATQAGKTTTLNCLAAAIPAKERVITCEEVFELQIPLPDVVALQTRPANLEGQGEVRLRRLIKEALRMRPNRLIVGEVRAEESLDLLIALNAGLPGMASIHANSAREALLKLTTLPLLAGENVSHRFIVPTVASCVDLVVYLRPGTGGQRLVEEVLGVTGRLEGDVIETPVLFDTRGGRLAWAGELPPHPDRFERAGYELKSLLG